MIQIQDKILASAAEKGMDEFLQVFTDAYLEALNGNLTAENMHLLNGNQHTLLAYRFFTDEMREGGFVQLIQNGYGGYIFGNPTAKALKQFGAAEMAKIIRDALWKSLPTSYTDADLTRSRQKIYTFVMERAPLPTGLWT